MFRTELNKILVILQNGNTRNLYATIYAGEICIILSDKTNILAGRNSKEHKIDTVFLRSEDIKSIEIIESTRM